MRQVVGKIPDNVLPMIRTVFDTRSKLNVAYAQVEALEAKLRLDIENVWSGVEAELPIVQQDQEGEYLVDPKTHEVYLEQDFRDDLDVVVRPAGELH